MEDLNKKYYGEKIVVVNSKSANVVRYKYFVRVSRFLSCALFATLAVAICINIAFILKGIINFV